MHASLLPLITRDQLREISGLGLQAYLHDDHKWALPIMREAQLSNALPTPCTLVMFDAHHDCWHPTDSAVQECRHVRAEDLSVPALIHLCEHHLRADDSDWVVAGMELGLIDNAVVFGVDDKFGIEKYQSHVDHRGDRHWMRFPELPHEAFLFQGALTDRSVVENDLLWSILQWGPGPEGRLHFLESQRKICLNVDLDAFVVRWENFKFPWPEEVWLERFHTASDFDATRGWTAKSFVHELTMRAGLMTIAREPEFCGGEAKADAIWGDLNKHLFDSQLTIRSSVNL